MFINKHFLSETQKKNKQEIEGACESAYLRRMIFTDASFRKI